MDHLILLLDAGWTIYGWLTAVFLVCTVVFALTLQYWITTFRHVGAAAQEAASYTRRVKKAGVALTVSAVWKQGVGGGWGLRKRGAGGRWMLRRLGRWRWWI